jgi:hypothetical protein
MTDMGTDGYQAKSGPVRIYNTSGTTDVNITSNSVTNTFVELIDDVSKIKSGITEFNKVITTPYEFTYPGDSQKYSGILVYTTDTNGKTLPDDSTTIENVFIPFSKNNEMNDNIFKRVYMIISDDILDSKKYESFKTLMIGNIINNPSIIGTGFDDIEKKFDEYWLVKSKPLFENENNITKSFVENIEKTPLKNFIIYTPFDKKSRVFTYTTETNADENRVKSQKTMISSLGDTTNRNTEINKWNSEDGVSSGAYISKVKLN